MTELRNNNIQSQDSFSIDSFGRWRTSTPFTIFESKQISDQHTSLTWDNIEKSGSSTSSSYDKNRASTTLSVADSTEGQRVRQTFRKFNYEPGKSQEVLMTFANLQSKNGITKRVGYFDDDNGLFLQSKNGITSVVRRTSTGEINPDDEDLNPSVGGSDFVVNQTDWNLDTMDGNGPSKINLNCTKTQIFIIDFEWLGVGRVRLGFIIGGIIYYVHEFLNANNLNVVYMSSPNLPLRYEILNDGTGESDHLESICSSAISEGGVDPSGVIHTHSTKNSLVQAQTAGTFYAIVGIKLKPDELSASVFLNRIILGVASNDLMYWEIRTNATVAGTFTYSDKTNSVIKVATGNVVTDPSPNTVTGGTVLDAGYITEQTGISVPSINSILLGSSIVGTQDELVLCSTPVGTGVKNLDVAGGLVWREVI